MREIHFFKASPIGDVPVEPVTMVFDKDVDEGEFKNQPLAQWEARAWSEAEQIAAALYSSVPQGTRWRLIIELMKMEQQLFYGIEVIPRDHQLIDWLEKLDRTELRFYESGGVHTIEVSEVSVDEEHRIHRRVVGQFHGTSTREALSRAITLDHPSAETVARAARDFIHEPENWEAYDDSKRSNSVAWPPEFLLLGQAVEKRYGSMPIDKCGECGAVRIDEHAENCSERPNAEGEKDLVDGGKGKGGKK